MADVDHVEADYTALVADRWQGNGLGGTLTDYCMEVARRWGVKSVVSETTKDNERMLATFRKRGVAITEDLGEELVLARKKW